MYYNESRYSFKFYLVNSMAFFPKVKKGVKRKADTTTPTTPVSGMVEPPLPVKTKAAKIPTRRESTRTVKKPNRDLPEEPQMVRKLSFHTPYFKIVANKKFQLVLPYEKLQALFSVIIFYGNLVTLLPTCCMCMMYCNNNVFR